MVLISVHCIFVYLLFVFRDNWKKFNPKTNVMWLDYLAKKLSFGNCMKFQSDSRHSECIKLLTALELDLQDRNYKSAYDLVLNQSSFKNLEV